MKHKRKIIFLVFVLVLTCFIYCWVTGGLFCFFESGVKVQIHTSSQVAKKITDLTVIIGSDTHYCGSEDSGLSFRTQFFFPSQNSDLWISFKIDNKKYDFTSDFQFEPKNKYYVDLSISSDDKIIYRVSRKKDGEYITIVAGSDDYAFLRKVN